MWVDGVCERMLIGCGSGTSKRYSHSDRIENFQERG